MMSLLPFGVPSIPSANLSSRDCGHTLDKFRRMSSTQGEGLAQDPDAAFTREENRGSVSIPSHVPFDSQCCTGILGLDRDQLKHSDQGSDPQL